MNLKKIKGVIGESLPVKPAMIKHVTGRKGKMAAKAVKKEAGKAAKGVVGENLPVQPTMMVKLMNVKGKLAAAVASVVALIAAISELM